jgi:hypothetical protein
MKITTFSNVGQLLKLAPNNQWSLGSSLRFITMVLETNQRTRFNQVSLKSKNRFEITKRLVFFLYVHNCSFKTKLRSSQINFLPN